MKIWAVALESTDLSARVLTAYLKILAFEV